MKELQKFDELHANIAIFLTPVKTLVVKDKAQSVAAIDCGRQIKSFSKQVEDLRKSLVAPLNDQVKVINDYAKKIVEPLHFAERHVKNQLVAFETELERARVAAAIKLEQEKLKKLAETKELEEKAAAALEELPIAGHYAAQAKARQQIEAQRAKDEIARAAKQEQKAIEQNKVVGTRKIWKFEVTDIAQVPRDFMLVNTQAVTTAIRDGKREIPGLRIFQETIAAL